MLEIHRKLHIKCVVLMFPWFYGLLSLQRSIYVSHYMQIELVLDNWLVFEISRIKGSDDVM